MGMKWIWRTLCLVAYLHLCHGGGQWDIELSPQSVASVPFGAGHVSIWEHANEKGRFFAMPQVCLLANETEVIANVFTNKTELNLRVMMWSEEEREVVRQYLTQHVNATVHQVDVLPMERIRLLWAPAIRPLPDYYQLGDHWQSNTHLPTVVNFRVVCSDAEKCQALKEGIQRDPKQVNGLELQYVINAQRTARRQITVKGSNLVRGKLFSKLANMPATNSAGIRFLRSRDVKRIASETVQNVISNQVTDMDYIPHEEETSLSDLLEQVLNQQQVSTENFQPQMWDSVFWDGDFARPDKVTSYLNKVFHVDATNTEMFTVNQHHRSEEGDSFIGIKGKIGAGASGRVSGATTVAKKDILKEVKRHAKDLQWTGEKFRVKPMVLSRLNLSKLNTSNNIATYNAQIRRYESIQGIKLRTGGCGDGNRTKFSPQTIDQIQTAVNSTLTQITNGWKRTFMHSVMGSGSLNMTYLMQSMMGTVNMTLTDFCEVPKFWCGLGRYNDSRVDSVEECRAVCRSDTRCKAFTLYRTRHCRLREEPCSRLRGDSTEVYGVKINPTMSGAMACQFLKDHHTYY